MITQLAKHQCKELVPTCEVLDISIPFVLVNDVTKLVVIQECNQLGKNIFWFVHMQSSILTAKIQNQIVAPEKSL